MYAIDIKIFHAWISEHLLKTCHCSVVIAVDQSFTFESSAFVQLFCPTTIDIHLMSSSV